MIVHSVIFKLKYGKGSAQEKDFLASCDQLADIPGVHNLKSYRQTGKKNPFDFGLFMEFETAQAYEDYNRHPYHLTFIQKYWKTGIQDFMEMDYRPLDE